MNVIIGVIASVHPPVANTASTSETLVPLGMEAVDLTQSGQYLVPMMGIIDDE